MAITSFFGGAFFGGEFFNESSAEAETPRPPRPADNERKRARIFKPTGLIDRPRTVAERVEQTREIEAEVRDAPLPEFTIERPEVPPVHLMSQAQIDAELGIRLRAIARERAEEDADFLVLMAMLL